MDNSLNRIDDETVLLERHPPRIEFLGYWLLNGILLSLALLIITTSVISGFLLLVLGISLVYATEYTRKLTTYHITDKRIVYVTGWFSKKTKEIRYDDIAGINTGRTALESLSSIGHITIYTHGSMEDIHIKTENYEQLANKIRNKRENA